MSPIDIQPLTEWINAFLSSDSPMLRVALAKQNTPVLSLAEAMRLLRQIGTATEVDCPLCVDRPHRSQVRMPERQNEIFCLENGRISLSLDEVTLIGFDRNAFMRALAKAIGVDHENIRYYAGNKLVRLGDIVRASASPPWVLAYADGLEDENNLAGVIEALACQFPKGPGLIATPSILPVNLPLPNHHRLIALHDLFRGCENGFVIDHAAADVRLGRRKKLPGQAGRPTERETTRHLWAQLSQREGWPSARGHQVELVLSNWPEDAGSIPASGTVEKHLREFESGAD